MSRVPGNTINLGSVDGVGTPLILTPEIRSTHLYVCGSTGTGKTKLLEHLVRQDIKAWRESKCGVLLLDPHGALYDSVLNWVTWNKAVFEDVPIVPIDLRRNDWTIGYNVLRPRVTADPSVLIDNFFQAMAYIWGEAGTDQTPRFARWPKNVLCTLYENKLTLLDAERLLNCSTKRHMYELTAKIRNRLVAQDWAFANMLSPKDFDTQISSTVNRLTRFLDAEKLRLMFGHGGASLDLHGALEQGSIILVNLSCEKAQVSDEQASLFATLLLSDLWTAAKERGKGVDGEEVKPFYVYIDEFQNFVTPTIAKNLDQARGFGLHLTLANQFPKQIRHAGGRGEQVFDSIMANARSKVVFEITEDEDLNRLALDLFRGTLDPDKIKLSLYSTKVMDYEEESRTIRGRSETSSTATGQFSGNTDSESLGGEILENVEQDPGIWNSSTADSAGTSHISTSGHAYSETEVPFLKPVMGQELSSVQFRSIEEQVFRATQALSDQEQRHGVARLVRQKVPVAFETPTVNQMPTTRAMVQKHLEAMYKKLSFALPSCEARRQIRERESVTSAVVPMDIAEPESSKRILPPSTVSHTPSTQPVQRVQKIRMNAKPNVRKVTSKP